MLFKTIFDASFDQMPEIWRRFHTVHDKHVYRGQAEVIAGSGMFIGLLAWMLRLPPSSQVPVQLTLERCETGEIWKRQFGASQFSTILRPSKGETKYSLYESYGPITFCVSLAPDQDKLEVSWSLIDWWLFGVKLPRFLLPLSKTVEKIDSQGRYAFSIDLEVRFLGRLIAYRGWLEV